MRPNALAFALLALAFGTVAAPVETQAQTTYVMPGQAYETRTIIERHPSRVERRIMRERAERRAARQERRELRALRLNDPDATTADLNASQLRKLDRQDRAEQRAEMRRERRMMERHYEIED